MNKILPLVLVVSISLIIGSQAAYAQTTDVWGMYCENDGAVNDANPGGGAGNSVLNCDRPDSPGLELIEWWMGSPFLMKNVGEQNDAINDPDIRIECYTDAENPGQFGSFSWDFNDLGGDTNGLPDDYVNRAKCVNNFRANNDLGIGSDEPEVGSNAGVDEVEGTELVAIYVGDLIDAGYVNFHAMFSSNQEGRIAWLASSDTGPSDGIVTNGDITAIITETGSNTGDGIDQGYNFITFDRWLYFKNTGNGHNLIQQIKATIPDDVVGGHGSPVDKTALMVTGAQLGASWMIPVLVAAIGIGLFVVTRKSQD